MLNFENVLHLEKLYKRWNAVYNTVLTFKAYLLIQQML